MLWIKMQQGKNDRENWVRMGWWGEWSINLYMDETAEDLMVT